MLLVPIVLFQTASDIPALIREDVARQDCRSSGRDEVVVCAKRGRSPYRLPERKNFDPAGGQESVMRERMRWIDEGAAGIQSCGPVGPGGWTGCMVEGWRRAREQTAWGKNVPPPE
jgi:hypothetical protein